MGSKGDCNYSFTNLLQYGRYIKSYLANYKSIETPCRNNKGFLKKIALIKRNCKSQELLITT